MLNNSVRTGRLADHPWWIIIQSGGLNSKVRCLPDRQLFQAFMKKKVQPTKIFPIFKYTIKLTLKCKIKTNQVWKYFIPQKFTVGSEKTTYSVKRALDLLLCCTVTDPDVFTPDASVHHWKRNRHCRPDFIWKKEPAEVSQKTMPASAAEQFFRHGIWLKCCAIIYKLRTKLCWIFSTNK